MGTRTNDPRSGRARRRGIASIVSFLLLFAFALGQGGSLFALADNGGGNGKKNAVSSDEAPPVANAPAEEDPAEEAPAEEVPAEEAPAEEAPAAEEDDAEAQASAAPAKRAAPKKSQLKTASAGRGAGILSHGGLHGGDIDLDFVAAGPFTYDHSTGLGGRPEFGYDNRSISKTAGVVESLEGGDFACGDLVTFFVQIVVADDADGSGTVELDMSFGAETTGQPGLGFDSVVSYGINTPDDGNVGNVGDNVVTFDPPNGAIETAGYDELQGTLTVTNLAPGETAIVRITAHLECEIGASPTGNILNSIEGARADDERVSVGQQTVPMKQVGGLEAAPAIEVTKDCPATAAAGDPITYEITVTNTGNVDLTEITVIDDIIGDLSDEFPDSLAVGSDPVTVTVEYTPVAEDGDPVINTVTATGTYDVNETSDTVSATADCTTDITHAPGIGVTKSCPGLVASGADISYTITVTNEGNEALGGVTVIDTLLGDITAEFGLDDPFPVGGEATAIVSYTPGPDEDPVINTVTATGTGVDSEVEASASATCTTDVSNPAIRIVKTVSEEVVPVGTTVTYTFVVTNTGDVTLYDITVDDDIMGHIGDIPVLDPGDSVTLTKDFVVGTEPVTNVATAVGEDILGRVVRDDDDAFVTPIAGENPPNPPGTPPETPFTGSDAGRLGLITLALLGIGMTVVAATRRRRPEDVV